MACVETLIAERTAAEVAHVKYKVHVPSPAKARAVSHNGGKQSSELMAAERHEVSCLRLTMVLEPDLTTRSGPFGALGYNFIQSA